MPSPVLRGHLFRIELLPRPTTSAVSHFSYDHFPSTHPITIFSQKSLTNSWTVCAVHEGGSPHALRHAEEVHACRGEGWQPLNLHSFSLSYVSNLNDLNNLIPSYMKWAVRRDVAPLPTVKCPSCNPIYIQLSQFSMLAIIRYIMIFRCAASRSPRPTSGHLWTSRWRICAAHFAWNVPLSMVPQTYAVRKEAWRFLLELDMRDSSMY